MAIDTCSFHLESQLRSTRRYNRFLVRDLSRKLEFIKWPTTTNFVSLWIVEV
jgi:hypothetical protein